MMSKLLFSVLGLCISSALNITSANTSTVIDQKIIKYTNHSHFQINDLHIQHKKEKKEEGVSFEKYLKKSRQYHFTRLSIGPYLCKTPAFDGSDLIVSIPTIREDARLILLQQQLEKEYYQLGLTIPETPIVVLSGKLEGQTSYRNSYATKVGTDIDLKNIDINFSEAELDTYVQTNPWVSGYMALDYDPDKPQQHNTHMFMNRAFIIIGNLSRFPIYTSIGQMYVPFGRYNSMMITAPVTQALGRTRARAITLGYQQIGSNALHAEIYGYQGITNNLHDKHNNNEWGTDIGYEFSNGSHVSGEVGTSFISNLADSQGIQSAVFLHDETLHHLIPVLGIYSSLAIKPVVFIAEYISALKRFELNDTNFENQVFCPRPTAFHMESSFTFNKSSKRLGSIGVGYGHTSQSLAFLGVPQDRYSVFYNVNIWKDTNFALEYHHDVSYIRNAIFISTNVRSTNAVNDIDKKTDNFVTVQFDLYF